MTTAEKQQMLDAHNAARCAEHTRGGAGANMVAVQWDPILEQVCSASSLKYDLCFEK